MNTAGPLPIEVTRDTSGARRNDLCVTLAYHGEVPAEIYRAVLPWATVQSMVLVAVRLDALGTVIEQMFPVDDPSAEVVALTPGQELEGRISLDLRFPGLAKARRERDVMVFWTYQMETVDGTRFPRMSGSVLLPKEGT